MRRPKAGSAPFHSVRSVYNPRNTAHVHCKRVWCAPSRETASAVPLPRVPPERRLRKEGGAARTSSHGLTPAKRGLSMIHRPFVAYGATITHAARRARTANAHAVPPPERQRAKWHARASHPKYGCAKKRPQLARQTTVLHQRREDSRRCSALPSRTERPKSSRHGARALQARMVRLLPKDSERNGTPARAT